MAAHHVLLTVLVLVCLMVTADAALDLILGRKQQKQLRKEPNPQVISFAPKTTASTKQKPVNILLMLADDLGYADTSVHPFVGSGIRTPELERMAARGMIMTNFHTAAATCTPTRASILTGMYPWRMGIKAVYEYGEKNKEGEDKKRSNRDDFLPQLPTVAMAFKNYNYSTGHSGKW